MNLELTLDSLNNTLTVEVTNSSVNITNIYVDTDTTFNCGDEPSTSAESIAVTSIEDDGVYSFTKVIDLSDAANFSGALLDNDAYNNMYFVYIDLGGGSYSFSYTYDADYLRQSIFDSLYQSITNASGCDIDNLMINNLLLYNAFNLAESYKDKIEFWDKLHLTSVSITSNCTCHG